MITHKALIEIAAHEGIVREAYKDSVGVWTWGIGVTSASGHSVERYIGNPQTLEKVLEVYQWLLTERYLPDVLDAFRGHDLQEHELAAALSFHWNTGGIKRASWVTKFKAGDISGARKAFMNWSKPKEIIPRRKAERDLFFDGKWSNDGKATEYTKVTKSGNIVWSSAKRVQLPVLVSPRPIERKPAQPVSFWGDLFKLIGSLFKGGVK